MMIDLKQNEGWSVGSILYALREKCRRVKNGIQQSPRGYALYISSLRIFVADLVCYPEWPPCSLDWKEMNLGFVSTPQYRQFHPQENHHLANEAEDWYVYIFNKLFMNCVFKLLYFEPRQKKPYFLTRFDRKYGVLLNTHNIAVDLRSSIIQ